MVNTAFLPGLFRVWDRLRSHNALLHLSGVYRTMEHGVLSRSWSSLGEVRQALSPAGLGAPLAHTMWRLAAVAQIVENTAPEQAVSTPWGCMAP